MGRVARAYRQHPHHHAVFGAAGISQTLLGQWFGLTQAQVSRIENGAPLKNMDTLAHWARVLRIPPDLLWFDLPGSCRADTRAVNTGEAHPRSVTLPPAVQDLLDAARRLADEQAQARFFQIAGTQPNEPQPWLTDDDMPSSPPRAAPTAPAYQAVTWEDMKRRTLMKWGVAATAAAGLSASAGTTVGMTDVKRLQRAAARLHSLDQQHGSGNIWQAALVQAHDCVQLLEYGSYTEAVGRQLLVAAGRLQTCAGWLALDAGHHEVARSCFGEALAMSRQANDAQIETRALANLALQSNVLARPREALRYATGAEQAATGGGAIPWLAAIPQFRLAIARSLMGDTCDAHRALQRARQVVERHSEAASEEWSAFLSPSEVDAVEAICAIELHQPSRAERLFEQSIAGYAKQCARNLALQRVRLARARLEAGTVDGAAEAAHAALDDLSGEVASWRVSSELDAVAKRLAAYPEVDGVEGFLARYQAVN